MEVYKEFDINIEEAKILKLLGYGDSIPDEEILQLINDEIRLSKEYLTPRIAYEKVEISDRTRDSIVLVNSVAFEGDYIAHKLSSCEYIIVTVTTLGKEIDDVIKSAFESGDYLRGMIVDNIGTAAIEYANKLFWNKLVDDIKNSGYGITSRLSPGTGGLDITSQAGIFKCIDASPIDVLLTPSYMMTPLKSTSIMYGFGKSIGITRSEHICSECDMKNCRYRVDNKVEIKLTGPYMSTVYANAGDNLLDILRGEGVLLPNDCGGNGTCGKCRVIFKEGVPRPAGIDYAHLGPDEINRGIRLSCGIKVFHPMEIEIPDTADEMDILVDGKIGNIKIEPCVLKKYLCLDIPSLTDQRSDIRRLGEALEIHNIKCGTLLLSQIPEKLRSSDFKITAAIYKDILISIEKGDTTKEIYGAALDIGTTTIACYLIDMVSNEVVAVESAVNRQKIYGADVISRINHTMENKDGAGVLKESVINQINEMLLNACRRKGISMDNVYQMTIAGNTTMIHLLLGLPCDNIALSPYIPVTLNTVEILAKEIGLCLNGYITLLPGISGYVGSDITCGILASMMGKSKGYSLFLDLGTNGEIALGNSEGIITCSTAAGPAFEGANIKWGMGGVKGAISKIDLSKDRCYETIGGGKPKGICGSGVLDMTYQLLKYKLIDETGRMEGSDSLKCPESLRKRISLKDGIKEFIIEDDIVFTQKDVREVQLASAAVSAGIKILMKEKGISPSDILNVFIAGGFGNFMDINSAIGLGLIPGELSGKVKSIGNSAGTGARMCLISRPCMDETEKIAESAKYVELSGRQDFEEYFMDSMMFGGSLE